MPGVSELLSTTTPNVIKEFWLPILAPLATGLSAYFIARRNAAAAEVKVREEARIEIVKAESELQKAYTAAQQQTMDRIHKAHEELIADLQEERDGHKAEVINLRKALDRRERENCAACPTRANLERQLGIARTKGE